MGAEVNLIGKNSTDPALKGPGYLSVIRKAARLRSRQLGQVVEWNRRAAINDTMEQCQNVAEGIWKHKNIKRIVVPTGSGLTAAGVLLGLTWCGLGGRPECPKVVAIATSPMSTADSIKKLMHQAAKNYPMEGSWFPELEFIGPSTPYDTPIVAELPDGTPCDPFYSAKALKYLQPGDLLWPVGLRPVCSMPEVCKEKFRNWRGPW
jgi:hypothetical protein